MENIKKLNLAYSTFCRKVEGQLELTGCIRTIPQDYPKGTNFMDVVMSQTGFDFAYQISNDGVFVAKNYTYPDSCENKYEDFTAKFSEFVKFCTCIIIGHSQIPTYLHKDHKNKSQVYGVVGYPISENYNTINYIIKNENGEESKQCASRYCIYLKSDKIAEIFAEKETETSNKRFYFVISMLDIARLTSE